MPAATGAEALAWEGAREDRDGMEEEKGEEVMGSPAARGSVSVSTLWTELTLLIPKASLSLGLLCLTLGQVPAQGIQIQLGEQLLG